MSRCEVAPRIGLALALIIATPCATAQDYRVASVPNGGKISGTVKWTGPKPRGLDVAVNKDAEVCDPEGRKTVNLERLVIGPNDGVANTVVFIKNISSGKAMILPDARRSLDQKHCRYEPHILLVPESTSLSMKSSDPVLHTIHMDGAATFNLPFPIMNQIVSRQMNNAGLVNLRCNGGHVWMNAEMMVVSHPYYAVTDESGQFELDNVPPGQYELVAWHEGWQQLGRENALDVFTQATVQRTVFSQPRTWEQQVNVSPGSLASVEFTLSSK